MYNILTTGEGLNEAWVVAVVAVLLRQFIELFISLL